MQGYATAERPTTGQRLRVSDPTPPASFRHGLSGSDSETALLDQLLSRLAELVVDRLMERAEANTRPASDWMDARAAAAYLGIRRDTLRKLPAERAVPAHQDGPGCKLYFRRDELDAWRRASRAPRNRLRAVS